MTADCVAAVEGVGLDPQVGYLHMLRPGRPALALDLVEEFRSVLADRLALTLINRRQLTAGDFEERPGGAVLLTEKGRRTVLTAYQERKKEELTHPVLGEKTPSVCCRTSRHGSWHVICAVTWRLTLRSSIAEKRGGECES